MCHYGRTWLTGVVVTAAALAARVDAADPKYLPADTEVVIAINVKQILDSELVKSQKEAMEQLKKYLNSVLPPEGHECLKKTGFDPFRDLTSITVAMPPSKEPDRVFVIVEGTFDVEKMQTAADEAARDNADAFKIKKAGPHRIYQITTPDRKVYVSLLDSKVLVACASEAAINAAIARAAGAQKATLKKEIVSLLQTTSDKQSISFVATGAAVGKLIEDDPRANKQALQIVNSVQAVSGNVTVTKDVQLHIGLALQNAATAKDYAQKANEGLKVVRFLVDLQAQQNDKFQPLVEVMKTLRANAQGSNLIIRGEISAQNAHKLIEPVLKNIPLGP